VPSQQVPRATSAFGLGFNIFFIWLLLHVANLAHVSVTLPGAHNPVVVPFALGTWWQQLIWPFVVFTSVHALLDVVLLARPDWSRLRAATTAVTHALLAIVVGFVLAEGSFVTVASGVSDPAQYASAVAALNGAVSLTLACFVLICVIMVVVNVRKLVRRPDILAGLT
jgi:hypothetical protein